MNDSIVFMDSNILLYAFDKDLKRKAIAKDIIRAKPVITTQVMGEVINVLYKKFDFSHQEVLNTYSFLHQTIKIRIVDSSEINAAIQIKNRYRFSFWDSLIIASALANKCSVLYSEDMQNGQEIDKKLLIINPFEA